MKINFLKTIYKKLNKDKEKSYKLINRQSNIFRNNIVISGGISYYGLSSLKIGKGTM